MLKRITRALLCLSLLPLLISASQPARAEPAPRVQACHCEAEIQGTHTYASGATVTVPIGYIVVTQCSSPADLVRRVEELTNNVRRQATAQAVP